MSTPFSRTMRSLEADGFRFTLVTLFLAAVLLIGWGIWFFFGRLPVYAVTDFAHLEVHEEAHPVSPPISGQVVATWLELGREVQEGDPLVELDSQAIRFQIEEKEAERAGLANQLERIRKEIQAERRALSQAREAESSAVQEAQAQFEEAEAAAGLAEEEASRTARLHEQGLVSQSERERAIAEARQRQSAAEARQQSLKRLEMDRRLEQSEKQAHLAELARKAASMDAQLKTVEATLSRLEHELERHHVTAPVSGRLGEVVPLRVGSVVRAGDRLAAVVPRGKVKIVAEFLPPEALGRIRPGQTARLRLEGFSWVHYGAVPAEVARVANETQNGRIRVELELQEALEFPVPLQHGLPGTLEVEVERISPAELVLRAAGRAMVRPAQGRTSRPSPSAQSH